MTKEVSHTASGSTAQDPRPRAMHIAKFSVALARLFHLGSVSSLSKVGREEANHAPPAPKTASVTTRDSFTHVQPSMSGDKEAKRGPKGAET